MTNRYELMVIVNPDIGGDDTNKRLDEIRKLISSNEGEIFFEDLWGMRDLAYRIKKHDKGYYAVFNFNGNGSGLKEIDETLRLDKEIMRHLVIKLPGVYEPVTLEEMDKNAKIRQDEWEESNEAKKRKHGRGPVQARKKAEPKAEAKSAPAKEESKKEEVKEAAPAKKAEAKPATKKADEKDKSSLEDVDAKLKSIIDNPDLNF